jgi:hypothetical protein
MAVGSVAGTWGRGEESTCGWTAFGGMVSLTSMVWGVYGEVKNVYLYTL